MRGAQFLVVYEGPEEGWPLVKGAGVYRGSTVCCKLQQMSIDFVSNV